MTTSSRASAALVPWSNSEPAEEPMSTPLHPNVVFIDGVDASPFAPREQHDHRTGVREMANDEGRSPLGESTDALESMVIGLTIYEGGAVGAAFLAAVFISNLPESISSTAGLVSGGWKKARSLWMWIAIALVSGLASLAGYGLFQDSSPDTVAFALAFAAGAILTMLADTMMPEAFEHGGKLVGVATTLGFAVAYAIQTLD
jgi:hypothetical protein